MFLIVSLAAKNASAIPAAPPACLSAGIPHFSRHLPRTAPRRPKKRHAGMVIKKIKKMKKKRLTNLEKSDIIINVADTAKQY
jgi:hypothetical protein